MTPIPLDVPDASGMPMLGLGTWQNTDHDARVESVRTALEMGYRHVDTAQIYGNEDAVGAGIEQSSVHRQEVFLATKVWADNLSPDDVRRSTEESLERLGTDYLDLLYVHWPARTYDPETTLPALATLRDDGLTDRIGVSNFEPHHLDEARAVLGETPFANQIELHPYLQQDELCAYAADSDVELVAYSPLARTAVLDDPILCEIADRHDATAAQVSLAWIRSNGITAIPKATGESHIRENWESIELELEEEDIERIDGIERRDRQVNPGFGPDSW